MLGMSVHHDQARVYGECLALKKKFFLIVSSSRLLWVMELLHVCGWNLKNLRPCLNTLCNLVSYYQTHCEYKVTHLVQFREAKVRNTEIPLADEKYLLLTILLKTDVGFIQKATCPYRCITLFLFLEFFPRILFTIVPELKHHEQLKSGAHT